MKLFKKIAISVSSQVDSFADRIENNEAVSSPQGYGCTWRLHR